SLRPAQRATAGATRDVILGHAAVASRRGTGAGLRRPGAARLAAPGPDGVPGAARRRARSAAARRCQRGARAARATGRHAARGLVSGADRAAPPSAALGRAAVVLRQRRERRDYLAHSAGVPAPG